MRGGFRESPLRLNEGLGALDSWNEDKIRQRAARLAAMAVQVWVAPNLSTDALAAFRARTKPPANYTLDDHPQLGPGTPMHPVFGTFRNAVLELDPCISEEILKLYVAYKAETNFVDVVPQKSRLRLSLNLPFHELNDPKGWVKDVTNLGRWGNGDAEVGLSTVEELPYVMGLVRQAFEKQMGNGAEDS